jgi:hypothetical protein
VRIVMRIICEEPDCEECESRARRVLVYREMLAVVEEIFYGAMSEAFLEPPPSPVKAKSFDEWLASTAALLEEHRR